ncbi:MAG: hypothetical protein DRJ52_09575 [Thermoprotei archaeon]|nr:MAG: hypothetical protein DRJ52_09575 [Thermoprotei archaeon]
MRAEGVEVRDGGISNQNTENGQKSLTLVDEWVELLDKYTDAPEVFKRASGYWLVSATMGKYVWVIEAPPKYPWVNLYVVLSSEPAFSRRSTVIRCAKNIYKAIEERLLIEKSKLPEEKAKEEVGKRFCEEFTVEGIADKIASLEVSKEVVLYSHEFGAFLQRARGEHLQGALSILAKLYYGEDYVQALSTRNGKKGVRLIPEGVYATMLAGMQRAEIYLNRLAVEQGLVRRLLLVCVEPKDLSPENYKPLLDASRKWIGEEFKAFAEKLYRRVSEVYEASRKSLDPVSGLPRILAILDEKVVEAINKIDKEIRSDYIRKQNPKYLALASVGEQLWKLTTLEAIADTENKIHITDNGAFLRVIYCHFEKAKEFLNKIVNKTARKYEEIVYEEYEEPIRKETRILNRILGIVEEKGWIRIGELLKRLGMTKAKIASYLETLLESGDIVILQITPAGKKPSIYVFRHEEEARKFFEEAKADKKNYKIAILYSSENAKEFRQLWLGS